MMDLWFQIPLLLLARTLAILMKTVFFTMAEPAHNDHLMVIF